MNGEGEEEMEVREREVYMWGYLPGALPERSPLLSPVTVKLSPAIGAWNDVCGGGCGFATAISVTLLCMMVCVTGLFFALRKQSRDGTKRGCLAPIRLSPTPSLTRSCLPRTRSCIARRKFRTDLLTSINVVMLYEVNAEKHTGKLITWGSTDDLGQSYVTSGKHGETPEPFPLPTDESIVKAAAGWAHCIAVTESGEVYAWGWKECVPTGKVFGDPASSSGAIGNEGTDSLLTEQVTTSRSRGSKTSSGTAPSMDAGGGDDGAKRRRISSAKQTAESSPSGEENLSAMPCLVTLNPGIRIATVAAGGRHSLVLSDTGQVWGWGYGGEGQLGLGSRVRMVSTPHLVPIDISTLGKERTAFSGLSTEGQCSRVPGSYIRGIACGGRHSAVITDAGALLTFGWGLYGQCGQGSTDDELSPTCVSSLLGIKIEGVAAGLWHTVCISADGDVYTFGGNQFGQLGTGSDQAETLPRLLDAPSLENTHVKVVSCGARHSAVVADDGKVFCWGWNKYGQLGLGDVIDRNIPAQVPISGCIPRNVACGWWHTLLLAESPT